MRRLCLFLAVAAATFAQTNVLTIAPSPKLRVKRGETAVAKTLAQLKPGYHTNSNTPSEDYLIPLKLTWQAAPLQVADVVYPKPQMEKYEFADKPLSVFSGDFEITTTFKIPSDAPAGMAILTGKLRYQACTEKLCLPPKTVDVPLTVDVR